MTTRSVPAALLLALSACCSSAPERVAPALKERLVWPTFGTITQDFYGNASTSSFLPSYYYDQDNQLQYWLSFGRFHRAIDIAAPEKTVVWAAHAGVARIYPWDGSSQDYGNHIVIDHGGGVFTLYAHLRELSIRDGESVAKNRLIGLVGSTGHSTGPHLHFEVRHAPDPSKPHLAHYIPGKSGDVVLAGHTIEFDY